MPRLVRTDFPGAVHHVYGRGNGRQVIFRDDADFKFFLRRLAALKGECGFIIHAFCLMPNHYHIALQSGDIALSRVMHRLLTSYARVFNDRWQLVGHPFQGRYMARLCKDDNDLRGLIRYIHLNPVKAGLAAAPEGWPWSAHQQLLEGAGGMVDVDFVRSLYGDSGGNGAYVDFMAAERPAPERPTLNEIAAVLVGLESLELLRGPAKTQFNSNLRRSFIESALSTGYRRTEIAGYLRRSPGAITQLLKKQG